MNKVIGILLIVSVVLCRHHERRGRFRFRGPPIPPPPPYLREVNGTARLEYFDIMRNRSLTIAQQKRDVQAWAAKYDITEIVDEYNANMTKMMEETRRNVSELIGKLPTVLQMVYQIMDNEDQTIIQQRQAYSNLSAQYPQEYRVIEFTFDQFLPKCGCGGEHDGRGRGRGPPPNSLNRWNLPKNGISGYDFFVESRDGMENGDELEIIVPVSPSIEKLDWKGKNSRSEEYLDAREVAE
uniref:ANIS5_cation-bd domain-containing protein n=1 Tax=Haemonchus contortus TaxID=6289 RepID=A0A7I4YJ79_HAECO